MRDYLAFNGYNHTLSVFVAESAQPEEAVFDRQFLRRELGIQERKENEDIPLLYALLLGYSRSHYLSSGSQIASQTYRPPTAHDIPPTPVSGRARCKNSSHRS